VRVRLSKITDSASPDFSVCEHCGRDIAWDEICYTHRHSGFAECSTAWAGEDGTNSTHASFRISNSARMATIKDPSLIGKNAEPVTWFIDEDSTNQKGQP